MRLTVFRVAVVALASCFLSSDAHAYEEEYESDSECQEPCQGGEEDTALSVFPILDEWAG